MSEQNSHPMIEQLLQAGHQALGFHLEGAKTKEHQALEFMDSLWDQMPHALRDHALRRLREGGLQHFADQIDAARKDLEERE